MEEAPTECIAFVLQGGAFGFYHDMAVTEHYYVLFQNPTRLDTRKLLTEYMFAKVRILSTSIPDNRIRPQLQTASAATRVWLTRPLDTRMY